MGSQLDSQNTMVMDVTYHCNAMCRYCQWGDKSNPNSIHRPLADVLLPVQTIKALGTERVVLSGGEPTVHPELGQILSYYRRLVDEVIVVTNGYGLDGRGLQYLLGNGATGITISIDSTHPDEAMITRQTSGELHGKVLSTLKQISQQPRGFELGINSVVSHPTANLATVRDILAFGRSIGIYFVKFQPVFDDGYVSRNAPDLLLGRRDVPELLGISRFIREASSPDTNPPAFWENLAVLAQGGSLSPESCGLGQRNAIATAGKVNVCYWVDSSSFGTSASSLTPDAAIGVRTNFETVKLGCKVGYHCFCNQSLSHNWREEGAGNG